MTAGLRPAPPLADARAQALAAWLDPMTARVRRPEIRALAARPDFDPSNARAAAEALVAAGRGADAVRRRIADRADTLRKSMRSAPAFAHREVLARHIRATVPDRRQARADLAALARHLDLDAMLEREQAATETQGTVLEVVVRALSGLFGARSPLEPAQRVATFEASGALALLCDVAQAERRVPTRRAAVAGLAHVVGGAAEDGGPADPRGLRLLYSLLGDAAEDVWVRRAALDAVPGLPPAIARKWLSEALGTEGPDGFLVRARGVELTLRHDARWVLPAARALVDDPSELVRFTLAEGVARRMGEGDPAARALLSEVLTDDPSATVRAWAATCAAEAGGPALDLLPDALGDLALVAGHAADALFVHVSGGGALPADVTEALEDCRMRAAAPVARRAAAVLAAQRARASPAWPLAEDLARLDPGGRRTVSLPPDVRPLDLAEALVPAATTSFGFSLLPSGPVDRAGGTVRVTRGDRRGPTLWRLLHELRHPAPAKRPAHDHTAGRMNDGPLRVPPALLGEDSHTGTPGARAVSARQGSWLPAVPQVDDYLHALSGRPITLVTAEGPTTIQPPPGRARRFALAFRLVWDFGALHERRVAATEADDAGAKASYVRELDALGFETRHTPPADRGPSAPYFPAVVDPFAYLVSLSANTLTHLAIVLALLLVLLFGRAALAKRTVRRARQEIPLVIGGWGTRGKSGTERLKAGMFEGLGVPFVSKTTGCEAMVLHAPPGGRALELFLYRPYDKATIWEQVAVTRLAARLDARVMLWECMALQPTFVDLLQQDWMRDDLSTLTNAYPDHEDVMGPSGIDVAEVIGRFAPPDGLLLSTEGSMAPVLEAQARARGAVFQPVSRARRELVPADLMARFTHAEHPANVALVAAVADTLGLDPVQAVGLMAEHVVPDVGALELFPPAVHMGRRVQFANGMSANDTLSFRHCWRRAGFADVDHRAQPDVFLVTVVNNRDDRVARSQVFARILAEDADAHRHVLIGTNLQGLRGYFDDALAQRLAAATVEGGPRQVDALFDHLRIPDPGVLGARCAARLGAPTADQDTWIRAVAALAFPAPRWAAAKARAEEARAAAGALQAACTDPAAVELADHLVRATARHLALQAARTASPAHAKALYLELARASLVDVPDAKASGDKVVAAALATVPPGAEVRLMGMQNIKGTGLDFAYHWVYWKQLQPHLAGLAAQDPLHRRLSLDALAGHPLKGVIAADAVLEALGTPAVRDEFGAEADALIARVRSRRTELLAARTARVTRAGPMTRLARAIERILDPFDGVRRQRRATALLDDLAHQRISHVRAQELLRDLTLRQKGGWLPGTGD